MLNIIKQEIVIDETLKKKIELICDFSNTYPQIINGSIRKIDKISTFTQIFYQNPYLMTINRIC